MTAEELHTPTAEEVKQKADLQILVIRFAKEKRNIPPFEWASHEKLNYSQYFRILWENGDIAGRYLEVKDDAARLQELLAWIQDEIERMSAADKEGK